MSEFPNDSADLVDATEQADVPEQSEQLSQGQPYDTLVDRGLDDVLDEGYSPPEQYSSAERFGNTAAEMREGEPFEERLRQEEPDVNVAYGDDAVAGDEVPLDDDILADGEVGEARAGRLVDPDAGIGEDFEKDLVGDEVGIDGAGASAEEAAVHIVDDNETL